MGRIVNPSDIKKINQKPTILNDLIMKIIKGEVVLILGHENMLKEEFSNGDLIKQMTIDFFEYKKDKDCYFNCDYQSFNDYYYRGADLAVLKQEIAESIDKNNYIFNSDDYSPIILELLDRKSVV